MYVCRWCSEKALILYNLHPHKVKVQLAECLWCIGEVATGLKTLYLCIPTCTYGDAVIRFYGTQQLCAQFKVHTIAAAGNLQNGKLVFVNHSRINY